jgi:hypothetical protein
MKTRRKKIPIIIAKTTLLATGLEILVVKKENGGTN